MFDWVLVTPLIQARKPGEDGGGLPSTAQLKYFKFPLNKNYAVFDAILQTTDISFFYNIFYFLYKDSTTT